MNHQPKQRVPATPADWLAHAGSDLKLARLGMGQDVLPEQVCFHAQQAVEKALKAVLLFRRIDFPFTHDLEELIATFERAGVELPPDLREAGMLTPYAVESRYPGYWGDISETDVSAALSLAETAITWAERIIPQQDAGR